MPITIEVAMRGFAIYFVFLTALPAYIGYVFSSLLLPARFAGPDIATRGAMSADEFNQYHANSSKAVRAAKPTLYVTWAIGAGVAILWSPWFLAIPAFTSVAYVTWYFQLQQRIEVAAMTMVAHKFRGMWEALLGEAFDTVRADQKLNSAFDLMTKTIKDSDTVQLEAIQASVSVPEWNHLRHATLFQMGLPDT